MTDDLTLTRPEVLRHALAIAENYRDQNLTLTLRQMYYQFVARGLLPNGQKVYKKIGDVLTEARYNGEFPIEHLLDRGRDVHEGDYLRADGFAAYGDALLERRDTSRRADEVQAIITGLPKYLVKHARWLGQDVFVSVWVEKQALEGVIQPIADELGVSWFACKGYPSVSALWDWVKIADSSINGPSQKRNGVASAVRWSLGGETFLEERAATATRAVVLYFGDHDPDGWEIPRSAERNIARIMQTKDIHFPVEFRRIALNMDQIRQYAPPPFEAKMTSARYQGYIDEHGTSDAWELDALEPSVLRDLIRTEVEAEFDEDLAARSDRIVDEVRERLQDELRERGVLK